MFPAGNSPIRTWPREGDRAARPQSSVQQRPVRERVRNTGGLDTFAHCSSCALWSYSRTIWCSDQRRNEVRWWRPGRPHVRTWGLSEANVLYWRKYLWYCWDFSPPTLSDSAPGELCPLAAPRYAPGLDELSCRCPEPSFAFFEFRSRLSTRWRKSGAESCRRRRYSTAEM